MFWVSIQSSRLWRFTYEKQPVSPLYRASALKWDADSPQKLIAMQDATGTIVVSYQKYLVENRAIPVVGIINAPRYGTPKDEKKIVRLSRLFQYTSDT